MVICEHIGKIGKKTRNSPMGRKLANTLKMDEPNPTGNGITKVHNTNEQSNVECQY